MSMSMRMRMGSKMKANKALLIFVWTIVLSGCSRPEITVNVTQIDNEVFFHFDSPRKWYHVNGSPNCLKFISVIDTSTRESMWFIRRNEETSTCIQSGRVRYSAILRGFEANVKAKPLRHGHRYYLHISMRTHVGRKFFELR